MTLWTLIRIQWDRALGPLLILLGVLALVLGWLGVSRATLAVLQTPYVVSGGIGGIVLVGLGATLLVSADLRDEWRSLEEIREALAEQAAASADEAAASAGEAAASTGAGAVVDPWAAPAAANDPTEPLALTPPGGRNGHRPDDDARVPSIPLPPPA